MSPQTTNKYLTEVGFYHEDTHPERNERNRPRHHTERHNPQTFLEVSSHAHACGKQKIKQTTKQTNNGRVTSGRGWGNGNGVACMLALSCMAHGPRSLSSSAIKHRQPFMGLIPVPQLLSLRTASGASGKELKLKVNRGRERARATESGIF